MLEHLLNGGIFMIPLVFLSILSIAIIVDRWRTFVAATADTPTIRRKILACLEKDDIKGAIETCQTSQGPMAAVVLEGLAKYRTLLLRGRSAVEMETVVAKTMEDYAPRAIDGLERRFNLLVMIATVSPLLGMTGTVTGMIKSFDMMQQAAGLDPTLVAGGISEALITTAGGLLVAMPAYIAYSLLSRRVDVYLLAIEEMIGDVVTYISESAR